MHVERPDRDVDSLCSAEATRSLLRAFFEIAEAWNLSASEQQLLLGGSGQAKPRWPSDDCADAIGADTLERLSYVLNVYADLHVLLPNKERANAWLRQPNTAQLFAGEPALKRMLSGEVGDLKAVAGYLAHARGCEFS